MSKSTPGPWACDGPENSILVWVHGPDQRICFMTRDGPSLANARLISAAPELLAALTGMLEVYWGDGDGQLPEPLVIQEAKAAIAKATAVGLITGKL